ncbi:MAG: hypothetical protein A3F16_03730 [Deltaproteobacteria bacterium RIFCSPHIGHO2_12_FULL_43_9]|nr:MAG: hypothetical protein A3F16_03730 [Deltaproteobacteria bacterium RIFCSPHIGHO2_12_FULL_43_9]
MPVIEIKALPQKEWISVPNVLKKLSAKVSQVMGEEPKHVWASWESIKPEHYVEDNHETPLQPAGTHPPIVKILAFEGRPQELVEKLMSAVAEFLVKELELDPGNVFIIYQELRSGHVFDGGQVVKKSL